MNKEFHYNIIYLISCAAGFSTNNSEVIARASQYTDDNLDEHRVYDHQGNLTILKATQSNKLFHVGYNKIWEKIHFIPGYYKQASKRKDEILHPKCVTPGSKNAKALLNFALNHKSKNLAMLGIAMHSYADTWAHQNFIGRRHKFNVLNTLTAPITRAVGHSDAMTMPDIVNLIWRDQRLKRSLIRNKKRLLQATSSIYQRLIGKSIFSKILNIAKRIPLANLISDLDNAIGPETNLYYSFYDPKEKLRLTQYDELAMRYTNLPIPKYNAKAIFAHDIEIISKKLFWRRADYRRNSFIYKFNQGAKQILNFQPKKTIA